jgi:LEA14-like dessication related protein
MMTMMIRRASLLVCLALLSGCATRKPEAPPSEPYPGLSVVSGAAVRPDQFRLVFRFVLVVRNPRNGGIKVDSMDYSLSVEGTEAGAGTYRESQEVGAGDSLSFPLEVPVDIRDLNNGIADSGGPAQAVWRFEARIRITTGGGIPLELSARSEGSFPVLRDPSFRIRSIAIERDLLVTTKLALDIEIENPNASPIELNSIFYDFYAEGEKWAEGRSDESAAVPAKGSAERTLGFTMNFANTDRGLFDLVAKLKVVHYRLVGEAKIATSLDFIPEFASRFDNEGSCSVLR